MCGAKTTSWVAGLFVVLGEGNARVGEGWLERTERTFRSSLPLFLSSSLDLHAFFSINFKFHNFLQCFFVSIYLHLLSLIGCP